MKHKKALFIRSDGKTPLGSDSYILLDGRWGIERIIAEVHRHFLHNRQFLHDVVGFCISYDFNEEGKQVYRLVNS